MSSIYEYLKKISNLKGIKSDRRKKYCLRIKEKHSKLLVYGNDITITKIKGHLGYELKYPGSRIKVATPIRMSSVHAPVLKITKKEFTGPYDFIFVARRTAKE